ncbi:MAG: gliding motility-associated C-terminal domain-containing protein [Cytophagales bacterium]|nr:gliding motility-associated C-terminal domain-containing protein [Cytophagales bacterium]
MYLFVYQFGIGGTPQTITFDSIPDKTCQDLSFALTATATSNLPVSFRVLYGNITLNGNIVSIQGPGTVVIEAFQYGNSVFDTAIAQTRVFNVIAPFDLSNVQLSISPMVSLCEGQVLKHEAATVDGLDFKWTLPNGGTQISNQLVISSASLSDSGNYSVTLFKDQCTFKKIDFLTQVHKNPAPPQIVLKDSIFTSDAPFSLSGIPSGGIFSGSHVADNMYYPNLATSKTDTINYLINNSFGCKNSSKAIFELYKKKVVPPTDSSTEIMVYEFVSDNGDGKNDYWQIDNLNKFKQYEIYVVDTWGNKVFSSTNYQNNWNGSGLPSGSYFYSINIQDTKAQLTGGLFITH